MLRTLLISLALTLCAATLCIAQELPPIMKAEKYQKGIYLDFDEFLNDAPSVKAEFELKPRSASKQFWMGGSDYDLVLKDTLVNKTAYKSFWGISTGDSVLINAGNFNAGYGFVKLYKIDRYCYFKAKVSAASQNPGLGMASGVAGGLIGATIASIPYEAVFVLNINNGNFYQTNRSLMKLMLKNDSELLQQYNAEEMPFNTDVMIGYIDRYNQKHRHEISRKIVSSKVIIYRKDKKETDDLIQIVTPDSLVFSVAPNDIKEFSVTEKDITLCIGTECKKYPVSTQEVLYLECSYKAADPKPKLFKNNHKVAEFDLRKIRYYMAKGSK